MNRGNVHLNAVHTMVLDEADEMLNMGFVKDVTRIIEATPDERQMAVLRDDESGRADDCVEISA